MRTNTELVLAAREASNVQRCHTIPYLKEYTLGQHLHGSVSLLLILHPNPSTRLIKATHWHDAGERWAGDMPSPAKWTQPELAHWYQKIEDRALSNSGLDAHPERLTNEEQAWLKSVDMLELWLWSIDQYYLGNRHILVLKDNIEMAIKNYEEMPKPCRLFFEEFTWSRLSEEYGLNNGSAHAETKPPLNFGTLTERERSVLHYLKFGFSNKIIARKLSLSEATVKIHMKGVCKKLKVSNRTEAVSFAMEHNLI